MIHRSPVSVDNVESQRIASLLGPTMIVMIVSEFPLVQPRLYDAQIPPVVYLSGVLMFVAGLAIVRAHNRWRTDWTVLVTLSGWFALVLGVVRMFAAGAYQHRAVAIGAPVFITTESVLLLCGFVMTFKAYVRHDPATDTTRGALGRGDEGSRWENRSQSAAPCGEASIAAPRNRVVQVSRFGDADALEVVDAVMPAAGRGEVRVHVLASSLHYTDVLIRRHLYPQTARHRPPFVLGYDVVGEIDQVGDGVRDFEVGDRVADMTVIGSNATYRTLRADQLTRLPPYVDAAEAATLILSWMTAYQLLHRAAHVLPGQRVLVHGAAGAVGQALLVLGRRAGLELWGTARGEHAALVRALGGTPIDYQREDFTRVVAGGFDVVVDGIGEDGYRRSLAALKQGGLLLAIGFSAGVQAQHGMRTILMSIARMYLWRFLPGGKHARFYSINAMRARHPAWFHEDLKRLFDLLATHAIQPRIAERISFDEVADAHRRIEAGGLEGKLVLCPGLPSRRDLSLANIASG
jgi:NADPH:quinone reductase-like Zn-dependent oxidoreductase